MSTFSSIEVLNSSDPNPAKRRPYNTNTDRTPPPRPPPPSREPSSGSAKLQESDEEILTEEEEERVSNSLGGEKERFASVAEGRVATNPKLYQLTSLGQSTGLWWDSFEEDLEELGMGGENECRDSFIEGLFFFGKLVGSLGVLIH